MGMGEGLGPNFTFNEIKLRRTEASPGKCIDFHTDFAQRTMQLPLNDESEYEGGQLVYLGADGKVHIPNRAPGGATIHDDTVVHGVTEVSRGTRYALFLLRNPNSATATSKFVALVRP